MKLIRLFALVACGAAAFAQPSVPVTNLNPLNSQTIVGRNTAAAGRAEILTTLPSGVQDNITRVGTITAGAWNGTVGATTPSSGVFTSFKDSALSAGRVPFATTGSELIDAATLTFNSGTGTLAATAFSGSGASVTGVNAATLGGATFAAPGAIGGGTPGGGAFTTISATGQITSTLAIGTAPLVITSTTLVPNLYVARAVLADSATTNANLTGPVTSVGNATTIANSINLPANPTTTTQSAGDNSTKLATTAYVATAVATSTGLVEKLAVFQVDGGGSAITAATVAGTSRLPFACTLTGYSISATAATGTTTVKFWNTATGTAIPTVANVINTSGVSLTTGTSVASATLSDFTDTSYAAGDMMRCAVTAVDGAATDLTVTLYGTRQ